MGLSKEHTGSRNVLRRVQAVSLFAAKPEVCLDTLPFTDWLSSGKNSGAQGADTGHIHGAWISFLSWSADEELAVILSG